MIVVALFQPFQTSSVVLSLIHILKEAAGMVMRGQLPDSKTALGLMMAAAKLGQL